MHDAFAAYAEDLGLPRCAATIELAAMLRLIARSDPWYNLFFPVGAWDGWVYWVACGHEAEVRRGWKTHLTTVRARVGNESIDVETVPPADVAALLSAFHARPAEEQEAIIEGFVLRHVCNPESDVGANSRSYAVALRHLPLLPPFAAGAA